MIRDPERHCGRLLQRLMCPAEIVERDMQRDGGQVTIQLFAEPIVSEY